ncbi:MAG: formate/nitrite transporter family protein, partial [Muribaculaceae bacterium]|nr:formate/nitrite transporter family protein [Muribaculaceae bacterium]
MPVRTPSEAVELAEVAGVAKSRRPLGRLLAGSALAGAYIALGGTLSLVIGFGFPEITAANPGLQRLLSGLVFPIGLMLVVILGADLFTGNNALLIPPFIKGRLSGMEIIRNWT